MNQNLFIQSLLIVGACWSLRDQAPYIGNLPGDFYFCAGDFQIFLPLASGFIIGLLISLLKGVWYAR